MSFHKYKFKCISFEKASNKALYQEKEIIRYHYYNFFVRGAPVQGKLLKLFPLVCFHLSSEKDSASKSIII